MPARRASRERVGGIVSTPLTFIIGSVVALAIIGGAAWWAQSADDPVTTDAIGDKIQTRRADALPVFAGSGEIATLYRFARERGDVLQWMPCTCGCQQFGHTSNRSCYIKAESADSTTWTSHAATWSLCLDITRDVMRATGEGRTPAQVRSAIDAKYVRGNPMPTPRPPTP